VNALLDEVGLDDHVVDVAGELEPLVELLAGDFTASSLDRALGDAAAALWTDEVAAALAEELEAVRQDAIDRIALVAVALHELERGPAANLFARALAIRAATALVTRANRNLEQVEEVEAALETVPADEHRAAALPLAPTAVLAVDIPVEETDEAVVRFAESFPDDWRKLPAAADRAAHWLARTLATDERRSRMRAALAGLRDNAAEDYPLTAAALEDLLVEPQPEDPADDDLWVDLVVGIAQDELGLYAELPPPGAS
jgi:hypothetical protein